MNNIYDDKEFFNEYAKMYRSQNGLDGAGEWHQMKRLFPDLRDKVILDLGCGYGWHCKYCVECGAKSVLGIDLSEKMIEKAKSINSDDRIRYKICGLEGYDYPSEYYDMVISNLVLHYIKNLEDMYIKINKTLKKDGVFVFNIEHPVFTGSINQEWIYDDAGNKKYWPVDRYFYPEERTTNFLGQTVVKQHHTLTQILMGLINNGFQIEAVEEAVPSEEMLKIEGMRDELRRPMMLLVRAKKI